MDINKLFALEPLELVLWLDKNFRLELPDEIDSIDGMKQASKLMIKLSGFYSYLSSVSSYAKIMTRNAKRKLTKLAYEDMVDREKAINNALVAVKQQYDGISRAVTTRSINNNELYMNTTGAVRNL